MGTNETTKKDGSRDIHARITPTVMRHLRRYDFADKIIPAGRVLDAACGSGYGSSIIGENREYIGVDLSDSAVSFAQKNYGPHKYHIADINALPFDANWFDSVVSFETLEHVPDPVAALKEFRRVLKPGGILVASVPLLHPDLIHHYKKYCYSEVIGMFEAVGLLPQSLFVQHHVTFSELTSRPGLPDSSHGTLIIRCYN